MFIPSESDMFYTYHMFNKFDAKNRFHSFSNIEFFFILTLSLVDQPSIYVKVIISYFLGTLFVPPTSHAHAFYKQFMYLTGHVAVVSIPIPRHLLAAALGPDFILTKPIINCLFRVIDNPA